MWIIVYVYRRCAEWVYPTFFLNLFYEQCEAARQLAHAATQDLAAEVQRLQAQALLTTEEHRDALQQSKKQVVETDIRWKQLHEEATAEVTALRAAHSQLTSELQLKDTDLARLQDDSARALRDMHSQLQQAWQETTVLLEKSSQALTGKDKELEQWREQHAQQHMQLGRLQAVTTAVEQHAHRASAELQKERADLAHVVSIRGSGALWPLMVVYFVRVLDECRTK
jgi:hypothetical protein